MNNKHFASVGAGVPNEYFSDVHKYNKFFNYKLRFQCVVIILQINAWSIDSFKKFHKFKNFPM